MKCLIYVLAIFLTVASVSAADVESVHAIKKGKPAVFTPEIRLTVIEKSVDLLSSCKYNGKIQNMPAEEKASQLHITFAKPRKIKVMEVAVEVKEMVVTFPLSSSGRIYVRTEDGVIFFTKFSKHELVKELQALFDDSSTVKP
jgi:hypothetical protein